jgi:hypothetical protein
MVACSVHYWFLIMVHSETIARATTDVLIEFDKLAATWLTDQPADPVTGSDLGGLEEALFNFHKLLLDSFDSSYGIAVGGSFNIDLAFLEGISTSDYRMFPVLESIVRYGGSSQETNGARRSHAPWLAAEVLGFLAGACFGKSFGTTSLPNFKSELAKSHHTQIVDSSFHSLLQGLIYGESELRKKSRFALTFLVACAGLTIPAGQDNNSHLSALFYYFKSCAESELTHSRELMEPQINQMWRSLLTLAK